MLLEAAGRGKAAGQWEGWESHSGGGSQEDEGAEGGDSIVPLAASGEFVTSTKREVHTSFLSPSF